MFIVRTLARMLYLIWRRDGGAKRNGIAERQSVTASRASDSVQSAVVGKVLCAPIRHKGRRKLAENFSRTLSARVIFAVSFFVRVTVYCLGKYTPNASLSNTNLSHAICLFIPVKFTLFRITSNHVRSIFEVQFYILPFLYLLKFHYWKNKLLCQCHKNPS